MKAEPLTWDEARDLAERCRAAGGRVVFTNGCFDLVHVGHVRYLAQARAMGDLLIVGVNSDAGVRRLKGPTRPIVPERERAEVLSALRSVDAVAFFDQDTPLDLIRHLLPDILAKGGDWSVDRIVGRDVVEAAGGKVVSIPLVEGVSTTEIARRILQGTG
jgi:D-glycero-beta-D-manno-heptose 1-phosphate adenylyltransferase